MKPCTQAPFKLGLDEDGKVAYLWTDCTCKPITLPLSGNAEDVCALLEVAARSHRCGKYALKAPSKKPRQNSIPHGTRVHPHQHPKDSPDTHPRNRRAE